MVRISSFRDMSRSMLKNPRLGQPARMVRGALRGIGHAIDKVQCYMYDIKPGESAFILGMNAGGYLLRSVNPKVQEALKSLGKILGGGDDCLEDHARILDSVLKVKFTPEKAIELFKKIDSSVIDDLPSILEKVKDILTPEQIIIFLGKMDHFEFIPDSFLEALKIIHTEAKDTFTPQQIIALIKIILKDISGGAFESLPALEKPLAILKPEQAIDIYLKTIEQCTHFHNSAFHCVLMVDADFNERRDSTAEEIDINNDIIGEINKTRNNLKCSMFKILPEMLEKVKDRLTPEQIVELFGKILLAFSSSSDKAIKDMELALANVLNICDAEQIVELFRKNYIKYASFAGNAFEALPAALESKMSLEQIGNLFKKNRVKYGSFSGSIFEILPVLKEMQTQDGMTVEERNELMGDIREECNIFRCKWCSKDAIEILPAVLKTVKGRFSREEIVKLYEKIGQYRGWGAEEAFKTLPAALEAVKDSFSPEQIIELFGKICGQSKEDSDINFEALPAALTAAKDILPPEQIIKVFGIICEKEKELDFEIVAKALNRVKDIYTPKQISNLIEDFVEDAITVSEKQVFEYLAEAPKAKLTYPLSDEEMLYYFAPDSED